MMRSGETHLPGGLLMKGSINDPHPIPYEQPVDYDRAVEFMYTHKPVDASALAAGFAASLLKFCGYYGEIPAGIWKM